MGTIIVGGSLLIIVASIIRKMILDKKQGKSCCSGSCGSCPKCNH